MNGGDRHALVVEVVIDHVALDLRVGEDQGTLRLIREDEVDQSLVLRALLDVDDLLLDVLVSAADATDLDTCKTLVIVSHVVFRGTYGRSLPPCTPWRDDEQTWGTWPRT